MTPPQFVCGLNDVCLARVPHADRGGARDDRLQGLTTAQRDPLVTLLRTALTAAPAQPPWSIAQGD